MVRLSKLSDYAVVVLTRLDATPAGAVQTAPGIAHATGITEPTVAKVLKQLGQAGLVASTRGARGGYALARPLSQLSIADVIEAVDGPVALTACVDGATHVCECEDACQVRGRWDMVNDTIRRALAAITLADMMQDRPAPGPRRPPAGDVARRDRGQRLPAAAAE
ncbi:MAG: SUF system Fe-S cluster assembly regulator [Acetobacteraceae bacterium]|nr:SUF system Fe-S cluster assembly regulator [Acetobacteraceae bacterium]